MKLLCAVPFILLIAAIVYVETVIVPQIIAVLY